MITITTNEYNTYFIDEDGQHVGTCSVMMRERGISYFGKLKDKKYTPAKNFTKKSVKSSKVYELILEYFPELRMGQKIICKGF